MRVVRSFLFLILGFSSLAMYAGQDEEAPPQEKRVVYIVRITRGDVSNNPPLHSHLRLLQAVRDNHKTAKQIQLMCELGPFNINAQDEHGNTALHYAVWNRNWELVRVLLDYGADAYVMNNDGESPASIQHARLAARTSVIMADEIQEVENEMEVSETSEVDIIPRERRGFFRRLVSSVVLGFARFFHRPVADGSHR